MLQLSDISPAHRLPEEGRLGAATTRRSTPALQAGAPSSNPAGAFYGWAGVTFAGIAYNTDQGEGRARRRRAWKDILNPAYTDGISVQARHLGHAARAVVQLRKLYGNDFWQEFAKQRPKGFDSRAQLFDRLAKGDDRVCALAEYAGYTLYKEKGAEIEFVAPADGLPATPICIGVVDKAPHPEAAKLFVDWALSNRGQAIYQKQTASCSTARCAPTRRRCRPASGCRTSSCSSRRTGPTISASHAVFVKEWNGIIGLWEREACRRPRCGGSVAVRASAIAGLGVGGAAAVLVLYPIFYLIQASLERRRSRRRGRRGVRPRQFRRPRPQYSDILLQHAHRRACGDGDGAASSAS